ncbi:MAG: (Fe-S)-binding protein [Terriglobia bacterium]
MRVALFVTCLVDQFFPSVGVATVRLLRHLGLEIDFPQRQTCCGQPGYNAGFPEYARPLARRTIELFEPYDAVVLPSGSCAAMLRQGYANLFRDQAEWQRRAHALAEKTYELAEFLVRVLGRVELAARFPARVTYHDSCHALRGLRLKEEPRRLLGAVEGLELVEMEASEVCCGFGGIFAVDFADISTAMAEDKLAAIERTGADCVVSSDSGCLMQIGSRLRRRRSRVRPLHLAELLAEGIERRA